MADQSPLSYFVNFVHFTPNPLAPLLKEFNRLAATQKWGTVRYKEEKAKCLLAEYDVHIGAIAHGTSSEKLRKLQALCIELGINPAPSSITACGKALKKIHVNIIDLLDARRRHVSSTGFSLDTAIENLVLNSDHAAAPPRDRPVSVEIFKNLQQLQNYTRKTGRYFPKKQAKSEGALGGLLREIR